ncbi:hypothetical protein LCGC14_1526450 [marine sediment metagenome]|uniref:Uncharacterized protein n=2 Tax=root TaxID=1 RepID=A0A0F9LCL3_9ZZZZ
MREIARMQVLVFIILIVMGHAALAESQKDKNNLNGFWVETSGRGVLAINGDIATFSSKGDLQSEDRYLIEQNGNEVTLTPGKNSVTFHQSMTTTIDRNKPVLSLKHNRYKFVPAPEIRAAELDGYWAEESKTGNTLEIRAMQYKDQASRYDFYWWKVNNGYASFQQGVDEDVPLKIVNGFIFTNPNVSDVYRHYAIKREDDTIYYVDSNGATWSETKTKTLKQYQPPKGFRDMTAVVERYQ